MKKKGYCHLNTFAEELINAGYRNVKQVVKERNEEKNPCLTCETVNVRCKDCDKKPSKIQIQFEHIVALMQKARREAFEEVFNYMYKLVEGSKSENVTITVSAADVKAIAKRYGVKIKTK